MKKLFFFLSAMLICTFVFAQDVKFGIRARYTMAKFHASMGKISANTEEINNVDLGLFVESNIGNNFSIQPGLYYIRKGGSGGSTMEQTSSGFTETYSEIHVNYLELPVNALYNVKVKPGTLFFGGGPYAGYALTAKSKNFTTTYSNSGAISSQNTYDVKGTFGSGEDDLPRLDYGLNALVGFRFNMGLEANFGYGLGFANLSNVDMVKINNRTLSVGIGYSF